MNAQIKRQWIAALRSGEYKKTKAVLHKCKGGFCIYGVLCDLYMKATGKGKWGTFKDEYGDDQFGFKSGNKVYTNNPPPAVLKWAGIKNPVLQFVDYRHDPETYLINLNDETNRNFAQMADLMEASKTV